MRLDFLTEALDQRQAEVVAKQLGLDTEQVITLARAADPTGRDKFVPWILKQMKFKNVRMPEDTSRVYDALSRFMGLAVHLCQGH